MKSLFTAALTVIAWTAVAAAQEKPNPPNPPAGGPPRAGEHPLLGRAFHALDANDDGKIDLTEFKANMPKVMRHAMGEVRKRLGNRRSQGFRRSRGSHGFRGGPPPAHDARRPGPFAPSDIERMIDEKVRAAVDNAFARRHPGSRHERGRAFGAQPPMGRSPKFTTGPECRPERDRRAGRPGQRGPMPLMALFDANSDRTIDDVEINRAAEALKKLDGNNDGKITPDELIKPQKERYDRGRGRHERGPAKPRRE